MFGMTSFVDEAMKIALNVKKFIPDNTSPSRFMLISFSGFFPITLSVDDNNLNSALVVVCSTLEGIKSVYGNKYNFTRPLLSITPSEKIFTLQIGMLEKPKRKRKNGN